MALVIKYRIRIAISYKVFTFPWYQFVDLLILSFTYLCLVYWIIVFMVHGSVEVPFSTEDEFDRYIAVSYYTTWFKIFSAFLTIFLGLRVLRLMTEQFPSFGALFDTIAYSIKDLVIFFLAILIIFTGFAYAGYMLFGPYSSEFKTFFLSTLRLFYLMLGQGKALETITGTKMKFLISVFFMIFLLSFSFILLKVLITIVIVRYKYLRSVVQLDNEAHSRIMKKKSEEVCLSFNKYYNLFYS